MSQAEHVARLRLEERVRVLEERLKALEDLMTAAPTAPPADSKPRKAG